MVLKFVQNTICLENKADQTGYKKKRAREKESYSEQKMPKRRGWQKQKLRGKIYVMWRLSTYNWQTPINKAQSSRPETNSKHTDRVCTNLCRGKRLEMKGVQQSNIERVQS